MNQVGRRKTCGASTKTGKKCRNGPGCGVHQKGKVLTLVTGGSSPATDPPINDEMGANEKALVTTLHALGEETAADGARYQMLRSLAKAVDGAPTKAALWKEYREALNDFKKDAADAADKSLERALEALRSAT